MGDWKLEVAKMFVYLAFPVAMFHYFNQPEYFEKWVIEQKEIMYPPDVLERGEELRRRLAELNAEEELARIKSLEKK